MKLTMSILASVIAGVLAVSLTSTALHRAGPRTYADCVLAYLKPAMSEQATREVCDACREKFRDAEAREMMDAKMHDLAEFLRSGFPTEMGPDTALAAEPMLRAYWRRTYAGRGYTFNEFMAFVSTADSAAILNPPLKIEKKAR